MFSSENRQFALIYALLTSTPLFNAITNYIEKNEVMVVTKYMRFSDVPLMS